MNIISRLTDRFREHERDTDSPEANSDPEVKELPDEIKIMRILINNNGRIRRSELQSELDWEEDRLESVLSQMEAKDDIRLTVAAGRTVISRPGYEPTNFG